MRKFYVGGNWKMNGSKTEIKELVCKLSNADLDPDAGTTYYNIFRTSCNSE